MELDTLLALVIIAVGLGGPLIWGLLRVGKHADQQ